MKIYNLKGGPVFGGLTVLHFTASCLSGLTRFFVFDKLVAIATIKDSGI